MSYSIHYKSGLLPLSGALLKSSISVGNAGYFSRLYDRRIDKAIAWALYKFEPLGYREIKRVIEERGLLNRRLTSWDVFTYHLQRMVDLGQVQRNVGDWKRGRKLLYSLDPATRQATRMKVFEPVPTTRKKKGIWIIQTTKQQKFLRNCLFILYLMAFKPSLCDGKRIFTPKAFSIDDILLAQGTGYFFDNYYISPVKIRIILNSLLKENLIKITDYDRDRFEFADTRVGSFIQDLFGLLEGAVLPRLIIGLKNLEKISLESYAFYESIMGKKDTQRHFGKFLDVRRRVETQCKENLQHLREKKEMINYNDYNIFDLVNELRSKYNELITEQPFLLNAFVDTVCPSFFGRDGKDKTYPKLLMVIS